MSDDLECKFDAIPAMYLDDSNTDAQYQLYVCVPVRKSKTLQVYTPIPVVNVKTPCV